MKRIFFLSISVLSISILLVSCNKGGSLGKGGGKESGQYIARINDSTLTVEDVNEEFNMLPPDVQEMFLDEMGMQNLVEELVKKEILYLESKKKGIQNTEEFKKRFDNFNKRLMVELLLEKEVTGKALVNDKEVKDFYDGNTESFVTGDPEKGKEEVMEFEKVEDIIRQYLMAEKQKEIFESYVTSLRKNYNVDINRNAVKQSLGNSDAMEKTE
jgi:hypothetical protein